jgi:hypothetical protein
VAEVGPLLLGESQPVEPARFTAALRGKLPAFRVESFGGTVLDIDLWGAQAVLFVQGPLPGADGDDLGPAPLVARAGAQYDVAAHLTGLRLNAPGVYRVIVADRKALDSGGPLLHPFTLTATCTSGLACERPVLQTWRGLFKAERSAPGYGEEDPYGLADQAWRTPRGQLTHAASLSGVATLYRTDLFPVFKLRADTLVEFMNVSDIDGGALPKRRVTGELRDILGPCDVTRPHPVPVHGPYAAGNFPDLSLTRCQVAHSVRLTSLLNSLANLDLDSGRGLAWVRYGGQKYDSVEQLMSALMDAGHRIELVDERSHAQTTTISVDGAELFWPMWISTGLRLKGHDGPLRMPVTRSRVVWRISGPDVNARIALGMDGQHNLMFVPELDRPPGWVGRRIAAVSTDPSAVIESFRAAAHHVRQVPRVRTGAGPVLGTSSDVSAAVRRWVWGDPDETLPFPLLQRRDLYIPDSFVGPPEPRDWSMLDLPHDRDDSKVARWSTDALTNRAAARRLCNMSPFEVDSPMLDLFPPSVRHGLCVLEQRPGSEPSPACRSIMTAGAVR